MPDAGTVVVSLLVVFAITYALRLAPFLLLRRAGSSPLVAYLGRTMPLGVMAVLVVYTLATVDLTATPHGLPEAAGVAATTALHLWRRNALLSIVAGTGVYLGLAAALGTP